MLLLSKSMRDFKDVRHSFMSWSLCSFFLSLVFNAVKAENQILPHTGMWLKMTTTLTRQC